MTGLKYPLAGMLFLGYALGNLYKFSYFSPDIRISLLDISVFLCILYTIYVHKNKLISIYRVNKFTKPFLNFVLWAFFSLLISFFSWGARAVTVGSLYLFRFLSLGLLFLFFKQFSRTEILRGLRFLSLVIIITGLFQYLFFPDIRKLAVSDWDPHYFRVVGSLLDPGFMGIMLLFVMLFLVFFPLKKLWQQRCLFGLAYLLFALTYSRAGFLAAFVALSLFAYFRKTWKLFFIGTVILTLTLILLPRGPGGEGVKLERTSTIMARLINWKNSLTVFIRYPVLGVGFNTYRYAQRDLGYLNQDSWLHSHAGAGADSSLLFVLATTGLFGFLLYLNYLKAFLTFFGFGSLPGLSLAALLVHSLFLNSLFYPWVLVWLALITALEIRDYKLR